MFTDIDKLNFNFVLNILIKYSHCHSNLERLLAIVPYESEEEINLSYNKIRDFYDYYSKNDPFDFYNFDDFSDFLKKISKKIVLTPVEYYNFARAVKQYFYFKTIFDSNYKYINEILSDIKFDYSVIFDILKYIDKDGEVLDGASVELKNIRKKINETKNEIKDSIDIFFKKMQKNGYISEDIITVRENFECVAVKSNYKNVVDGIVIDYSNTGQTAFVVPHRVISLHSELAKLKYEEIKEIERILSNFNEKINSNIYYYEEINKKLINFDYYHTIAKFGLENGYNIPAINNESFIKIINGRHPMLGERAVPLNIEIGKENRILIITGPNAGGKTVCLKTIGLFSLMFLCGFPLPCSPDSSFCFFSSIFVDIGDNQSIENSLSTFSSHIAKIKDIIENINENSLVIIDELGRGTDPVEGEALALSIIEKLLETKALALISTHFPKVKYFATTNKGILNSSMEFDDNTLSPTYRLLIGQPGKSHAFEISQKMGLDYKIIEKAKSFLDENYLQTEKVISELQNERIKLINANEEMEKKLEDYNKLNEKLKNELLFYKQKEKELQRVLNDNKKEFLEEYRKKFEQLVKEIKESNASKENIVQGKNFFKDIENEIKRNNEDFFSNFEEEKKVEKKEKNIQNDEKILDELKDFKVGDRVIHRENNNKGYIVEINKKGILVQFGIIKINCKPSELLKVVTNNQNFSYISNLNSIKTEVDVRGKTLDESITIIEKLIDQAILASVKEVKVIHGHGTGVLRKGIQDYLSKSPFVESYSYENLSDYKYNYGVTVIRLK